MDKARGGGLVGSHKKVETQPRRRGHVPRSAALPLVPFPTLAIRRSAFLDNRLSNVLLQVTNLVLDALGRNAFLSRIRDALAGEF